MGLVPEHGNVVDNFNEAHDDVQICWTNVGQGNDEYDKFQTAISAGKGAPDVVMLEADRHRGLRDPGRAGRPQRPTATTT